MKRGPKPLPADQRLSVNVVIRVTPAIADGIFLFAGRRRKTLSDMTRDYWVRLLAKERELVQCQINQLR